MFRTVPLSIIRSFSLHTQQWYMSYRFADPARKLSANLYDLLDQNQTSSVLILLTTCQQNLYDMYHC